VDERESGDRGTKSNRDGEEIAPIPPEYKESRRAERCHYPPLDRQHPVPYKRGMEPEIVVTEQTVVRVHHFTFLEVFLKSSRAWAGGPISAMTGVVRTRFLTLNPAPVEVPAMAEGGKYVVDPPPHVSRPRPAVVWPPGIRMSVIG